MTSPIREGLGLLREADFARLFAAYLITHAGSAMAPIAIAFGVLELTGSTRVGAYVVAAPVAAQIVVLLLGGAVADRIPRQRILVRADVVSAAAQSLVAFLFLTERASVPGLIALMAINGVAFAFHQPAAVGFIPEVVPAGQLQAANALLATARSSALMVGAALAGMLVGAFGAGLTIALDAISFSLAAWLVSGIRARVQASRLSTSLREDLLVGWREFIAHDWLWTIVLQFTFLIMGVEALFALVGPATARDTLGGARIWGLVMAFLGAGTLLGGWLSLRLRIERPMLVAVLATFLWALLPILLSGPAPIPWIYAASFVQGAAAQIFSVLWYTTLHTQIPPDRLSRVSAYDHLGSVAFAPVGVVVAGALYESIGGPATLRLIATTMLIPTALVLFVPGVRRLRAVPPEAEQTR